MCLYKGHAGYIYVSALSTLHFQQTIRSLLSSEKMNVFFVSYGLSFVTGTFSNLEILFSVAIAYFGPCISYMLSATRLTNREWK